MPPASSAAGADSDMIIKDEVVRTLGNELAKTRGAQDRLKTENDVLRRQLEDTRYRLRALEETERERAKSAKDVVSSKLYEETRLELQSMTRERDEERENHQSAMNEITTKHSKLREKYDKKKTSLQEAEAELGRFRELTATAVAQLSSGTGDSVLRKRKSRADDSSEGEVTNAVGAGSKEVQNKEPQQVAPVPIPLPRNITRMVGKPAPTELSAGALDVQAFLNIGSRGDGLCEPSLERYDKFDGSWLDMHRMLSKAKLGRAVKYCDDETLIWSTQSPTRCIFMHPVHGFFSKTQRFKRHSYKDYIHPRSTPDVCLSKGTNPAVLYYCGTFVCVGASELSVQDLVKLGIPHPSALLNVLIDKVSVLGARPSGLPDMIRQSFHDGSILIRCHKLEYVARNETMSKIFNEQAGRLYVPGQGQPAGESGSRGVDTRSMKKQRQM